MYTQSVQIEGKLNQIEKARSMAEQEFWAIVKRGKIVTHKGDFLNRLLIFRRRYQADAAVYEPSEKVIKVKLKEIQG